MATYISGPMSNHPDLNFPAFFRAAEKLRAKGHNVVNPAALPHINDDLTKEWGFYMREDLRALLNCDAIYMLPGWGASKGAQLELHVAKALNMKVHYPGEEL